MLQRNRLTIPAKSAIIPLIAGVGASAGGLEAMLSMFARMRPTGRIAYVVAQHMMHQGHSDLIARLIQRGSALPVEVAGNGVRLQADHVYVIPSGNDGRVKDGCLELSKPSPDNISTPSVNVLFRSVAETQQGKAIGILLSGAGTDGTVGCRAIKAGGGLTFAQDPAEAKFDGMPTAAIGAKLIDQVLRVEQIGETLAQLFPGRPEILPSPRDLTHGGAVPIPPLHRTKPPLHEEAHPELAPILGEIREITGIDFSSYKEETLLRRLEKRKAVLQIDSAEGYRAFVRQQPEELRILQHLFLVSVSSFFRDRESFRVLAKAVADLVQNKATGEPIRVWVPGCASGEECYTLAIVLLELLCKARRQHPILITGTDLNPEALEKAREGVFHVSATKEVEDALRSKYFALQGRHLTVRPELKASVVFERKDVFLGAPSTGLDLVSCRNLLIYLKGTLQDQLFRSFQQALHPDGLLFIGQAESLSFLGGSLFSAVDFAHRVFRRRL